MPFTTQNKITATGKADDIDVFKSLILSNPKTAESCVVDYEVLLPMPDIIKGIDGRIEVAVAEARGAGFKVSKPFASRIGAKKPNEFFATVEKRQLCQKERLAEYEQLLAGDPVFNQDKAVELCLEDAVARFAEDETYPLDCASMVLDILSKDAKRYVKRKYKHSNPLDWAMNNWGNRWSEGVNCRVLEDSPAKFVVSFDSSNTPPTAWINKVISEIDHLDLDLNITFFATDEDGKCHSVSRIKRVDNQTQT